MTTFNPAHPLVLALKGWDSVKFTDECLHCNFTGKAPGDGLTECGFCTMRPRNIVVRQQETAGAWVPRDAWYTMDADTGEAFSWHYERSVAMTDVAIYEFWPR